MISPAFNTKLLQEFILIFNDKNKTLLNKLEQEIGKGEFDLLKYIEPLNLDTICSNECNYIKWYLYIHIVTID